MPATKLPIWISLSCLILLSLTLGSPPCQGHDIEDEYAFASHLIATKDYNEALLSLRRYTLFSDNEPQVTKARFVAGSIYDILKRHDRATVCFLELANDPAQQPNYREHAALMALQSMFQDKDLASFHIQLDALNDTVGSLSAEGESYRRY